MKQLLLTINQQTVTAAPGTSILEAAAAAGIVIPTLCFHKSLEETGSCWMCIVEIKGKNRFVPSCDTLASEGMVIETDNGNFFAGFRGDFGDETFRLLPLPVSSIAFQCAD